ncbi:hypothetical protein M011DRAFT_243145 [Sporormia fimetaria CBS 119925]|uniref:Uncharacterized protein n=1 Tax=Sporormia fimetaria CBS 119925 TaxID=1340428 RepID=A0A6A6VIK2_9PLEO|nr:hypothetical protein M011DRAFT_243145 [Sporormia fimetaria CBS 119925]
MCNGSLLSLHFRPFSQTANQLFKFEHPIWAPNQPWDEFSRQSSILMRIISVAWVNSLVPGSRGPPKPSVRTKVCCATIDPLNPRPLSAMSRPPFLVRARSPATRIQRMYGVPATSASLWVKFRHRNVRIAAPLPHRFTLPVHPVLFVQGQSLSTPDVDSASCAHGTPMTAGSRDRDGLRSRVQVGWLRRGL